jgi:hypothetical protein
MWRGKGEASERAACGERGVAADQLVGSDRHGASVSAHNRLSELCRRTSTATLLPETAAW